jgi:hypothetical protein
VSTSRALLAHREPRFLAVVVHEAGRKEGRAWFLGRLNGGQHENFRNRFFLSLVLLGHKAEAEALTQTANGRLVCPANDDVLCRVLPFLSVRNLGFSFALAFMESSVGSLSVQADILRYGTKRQRRSTLETPRNLCRLPLIYITQ